MKSKIVTVTCIYTTGGPAPDELLRESFQIFLRNKLSFPPCGTHPLSSAPETGE